MEQITVADRMLNDTGVAQASDMCREADYDLAQREVNAQTLYRRFNGYDALKGPPKHLLSDDNGVVMVYFSPLVDVRGLDRGDSCFIGSKSECLLLDMSRRIFRTFEHGSALVHFSPESGILIFSDSCKQRIYLLDPDT